MRDISTMTEVQRDQKRLFTKSEKLAVQLVTGDVGEGDHIKPYSAGGVTAVENCQLLTPEANKAKGAFVFTPRDWQLEFFSTWGSRDRDSVSFMLNAAPGAGKTMAALEITRRWRSERSNRQIIIVVPSDNLREQWRDEAMQFGINLQTKEFGTDFKHGFQGGVFTYQGLRTNALVARVLCSKCPTMVIFDEIHHCGEDASFGVAAKEAFELAEERLLLSGTPWKSDGSSIPYVNYDDTGRVVCDYTYSHAAALRERVLRHLVFYHSMGTIINEVTLEKEYFDSGISEIDAAKMLRKILEPEGDFVKTIIADAHEKLKHTRASVPDAAAIAVCIDQQHAVRIAKVIRKVTGCDPSIVVSDDASANDSVKAFRDSSKEWLVSVKKVSEGTDIKRLQVLCYLTNVTSELFFRQVIGRVCRVRKKGDFEAFVYLPSDPRLIEMSSTIKQIQDRVLKERIASESRESKSTAETPEFDPYSTAHNGTEVVYAADQSMDPEEAKWMESIAIQTDSTMTQVMQILSFAEKRPAIEIAPQQTLQKPLEDVMDDLRSDCHSYASKIANALLKSRGINRGNTDSKSYHAAYQNACREVHSKVKPFVPVKQASKEQLEYKKSCFVQMIKDGV